MKLAKAVCACAIVLMIYLPIVEADDVCDQLLEFEKNTNSKTPFVIDLLTELIQIRVNCEAKVVNYVKQIMIDPNDLAKGAKKRKQRQHTQLHCNREGLARTLGWTAMDTVYDKDMKYVVTLLTSPEDCSSND